MESSSAPTVMARSMVSWLVVDVSGGFHDASRHLEISPSSRAVCSNGIAIRNEKAGKSAAHIAHRDDANLGSGLLPLCLCGSGHCQGTLPR